MIIAIKESIGATVLDGIIEVNKGEQSNSWKLLSAVAFPQNQVRER
jgi:hypothetical protein